MRASGRALIFTNKFYFVGRSDDHNLKWSGHYGRDQEDHRPISELTELSRKMSDLDFEAKYESKVGNEIDVLGDNFNRMSSQLETTISELKSANNELQRDIEDKIKIDKMRKEFLDNAHEE